MSTRLPGYVCLNSADMPERDAAGRVLGDISHVQQHLPGKRGVATVVIPPSTSGGTPAGYNPHDIDAMVINYDPGRSSQVSATVGEMRERMLAQVTSSKKAVTGAASHAARGGDKYAQYDEPERAVGNVVAAAASPNYNHPAEVPAWASTGAAVANAVALSTRGLRPLDVINRIPQQAAAPQMDHPAVSVTFDVAGVGPFTASYSAVIINEPMLVLVFDHAVPGRVQFFPKFESQDIDKIPQVALRVGDQAAVHLIETTGIQFRHGTLEFCVLLITKTVTGE